jgi:hypothetical protein
MFLTLFYFIIGWMVTFFFCLRRKESTGIYYICISKSENMKKAFSKLLIIGIVSFSIVYFGCKKESVSDSNYYLFGSTVKNNIRHCGILRVDTTASDTIFNYQIMFSSDVITYNSQMNWLESDGDYITLHYYTTSVTNVLPGTYTYDKFLSETDFTVGSCWFFGEAWMAFNNGVMDVLSRGNSYVINLEFYYTDPALNIPPVPIKANYSGSIEDFTPVKK